MSHPPYFHPDSGAVRFWVAIADGFVGASITKSALHYRFRPGAVDDDPLETFVSHAPVLEAAVRRRVAQGSIEPVMLREHDLRPDADADADAGPRPA
ncbi:MAG: hypothetical protein KA387_02495 [Rubrivivax sp.]|nr:hypothetical protein [Rubrivivax sp.]